MGPRRPGAKRQDRCPAGATGPRGTCSGTGASRRGLCGAVSLPSGPALSSAPLRERGPSGTGSPRPSSLGHEDSSAQVLDCFSPPGAHHGPGQTAQDLETQGGPATPPDSRAGRLTIPCGFHQPRPRGHLPTYRVSPQRGAAQPQAPDTQLSIWERLSSVSQESHQKQQPPTCQGQQCSFDPTLSQLPCRDHADLPVPRTSHWPISWVLLFIPSPVRRNGTSDAQVCARAECCPTGTEQPSPSAQWLCLVVWV